LDLFRNIVGEDGGTEIGNALGTNGTLEQLDLGFNRIGEAAGEALGNGLAKNAALQVLNLGGNGQAVTPKPNTALTLLLEGGVRRRSPFNVVAAKAATAGGKGGHTTVEGVYAPTGIGDRGGRSFAAALLANESLTYLHIGANKVSTEGGVAIAKAMLENYSLLKLNLTFNGFGAAARAALAETKANQYVCEIAF
jgi:Ran GTPase-activating protein (RanGAP) involved in mRNA processing and transport